MSVYSDTSDSEASSHVYDEEKGDFNHGDIINNTYVLIRKLGAGTYSTVWIGYKLHDNSGKKYYAIKVHHIGANSQAYDEYNMVKLMKENEIKMIPFYEKVEFTPFKHKKKCICLVYDIMTCSVSDLLDMYKYEEGMPENIVLHIVKSVTRILRDIHDSGYIYCDLRPENILIQTNNDNVDAFCFKFSQLNWDKLWYDICEGLKISHKININNKKHKLRYAKLKRKASIRNVRKYVEAIEKEVEDIPRNIQISDDMNVYLTDFGGCISKEEGIDSEQDSGLQCIDYRSPECLLCLDFNEQIDVWSLGGCMFEMLTGEVLVSPKATQHLTVDQVNVKQYIILFGEMPLHMTKKCDNLDTLFDKKGKFFKPIKSYSSLEKELERLECDVSEFCIQLMKDMLTYNPVDRITTNEILQRILSPQSIEEQEV